MAAKKGGLGRGLDALFADNVDPVLEKAPQTVPIGEIEPNREQPRKAFDQKALEELADSIREHGLLQPLLVKPLPGGQYQIVAGERRWRASRMAGLSELPVLVRELTDEQAAAIALIENLQREDLNPIEEALGYQSLMEKFGMTQEQTAKRVGKSRPAVANALRLLNLPASVIGMLEKGELSVGHGKVLLSVEKDKAVELAVLSAEKGWSVRELERAVKLLDKQENTAATAASKTVFGSHPFFAQVQAALADKMGRKVKVIPTKDGKGKLEIEFFSEDELTSFAKLLGGED